VQREPRFQRGKSRLSASFLEEPELSVENQENSDDRSLHVLAQDKFQHDRSLEHPGNRCPELGQRPAEWMQSRVGHCVWPELLEPAAGFITREAGREREILNGRLRSD